MKNLIILVFILIFKSDLSLQDCSASQPCSNGACCSKWGYCGYTDLHCGSGCLANCAQGGNVVVTTTIAPVVIVAGDCSATKLCAYGACCSKWGYCGFSDLHCGSGCLSQCGSGSAATVASAIVANSGSSVTCSASSPCSNGACCSKWGYCGTSTDYCGSGCQSNCNGGTSNTGTNTGTNTDTNTGTNGYFITKSEFLQAVICKTGTVPTDDQYNYLVSQATAWGGITTKREMAMFLAQILWESDGLAAKREYACLNTGCPGTYNSGQYSQYSAQSYYGRGYIQLSWDYNYYAASMELYGDDRLLRNPDQVATNDEVSWKTSFWFWKKNVHLVATTGQFGATTNMINGALECRGGLQYKARLRFEIYKCVLQRFSITEVPVESGCYN